MSIEDIVFEANSYKRLRKSTRYSHYEHLKDELQKLELGPKKYQQAVRRIAAVLRI